MLKNFCFVIPLDTDKLTNFNAFVCVSLMPFLSLFFCLFFPQNAFDISVVWLHLINVCLCFDIDPKCCKMYLEDIQLNTILYTCQQTKERLLFNQTELNMKLQQTLPGYICFVV